MLDRFILNFMTKEIQISMEFKWKHFRPNSMMQNLPQRGVPFLNSFFEDNAYVKFGGVYLFL